MLGIHCAFQGTLTQDPVLHWAANGSPALDLSLAVAQEESHDPVLEGVVVTLFGEPAAELAEKLKSGAAVLVEGRLRLGT